MLSLNFSHDLIYKLLENEICSSLSCDMSTSLIHSGLRGTNVPECDSYSQCNQEYLHQVLLIGKLLTEQQEPGAMNKSESDVSFTSQFVSTRDFSNLFELINAYT